MLYWVDIRPGDFFQTGSLTVTHEEITEFAAEFDPQPYHLDTKVAEESLFGGLCASGWQVSALMMRLLTETFKRKQIAMMGVSAVSAMSWKMPVFAGDSLTATLAVAATSADTNFPGLGSVDCDVHINNGDGNPVTTLTMTLLIELGPEHDHAR